MAFIILVVLLFACLYIFFRQQSNLIKDTELMRGFFSGKTWLVFRQVIQKKRMVRILIICELLTALIIIQVIFTLIAYFLPTTGERIYHLNWLNIIFWPSLTLISWILYFFFRLRNTDKIKVIFRPNNPSAEFLREYHLTNDSFSDCRLVLVIDRFIAKINEFGKVGQRKWILFAISNLFAFYLNLEKLIDKNRNINYEENKYNFANKNSQISFKEMLKIVNDYFNSLNLEIKVLRLAKGIKI